MAQHTCETRPETMSAKRMTHHQNQTRHLREEGVEVHRDLDGGRGRSEEGQDEVITKRPRRWSGALAFRCRRDMLSPVSPPT